MEIASIIVALLAVFGFGYGSYLRKERKRLAQQRTAMELAQRRTKRAAVASEAKAEVQQATATTLAEVRKERASYLAALDPESAERMHALIASEVAESEESK